MLHREFQDMMEPYSQVIGSVTIHDPIIQHQDTEFAAWFTDYALKPGEYELRVAMKDNGYPAVFVQDIPAEIVNEDNQSRIHGVPGGGNNASNIGKQTTRSMAIGQVHFDGKSKDALTVNLTSDLVNSQDHGYNRLDFNKDSPDYSPFMENNSLQKDRERALKYLERSGSLQVSQVMIDHALKNDLLSLESIGEIKESKERPGLPIDRELQKVVGVDYALTRKTGQGLKQQDIPLSEACRFEGNNQGFSLESHISEAVADALIEKHELKKRPGMGQNQGFPTGMS